MPWLLTACLALTGLGAPPERVLREHDVRFLTQPVPQFPAKVWPRAGGLLLQTHLYEYAGEPTISFSEGAEDDAHPATPQIQSPPLDDSVG